MDRKLKARRSRIRIVASCSYRACGGCIARWDIVWSSHGGSDGDGRDDGRTVGASRPGERRRGSGEDDHDEQVSILVLKMPVRCDRHAASDQS